MLPESPKILAPMILLHIFKLLVERGKKKKKKAGFSNIAGLESEDQGDPAK